jgi:uncharacterized membrane protein
MKIEIKRHLAKTVSYRIISTTFGFLVMWLLTGNITIGAAFGIGELLFKPFLYFLHERVWYKWIRFGLKED